ncbi:MAG: type II secretion system protein [Candidatus Saccharibacteria bacterium]|nr:type II secretion system protein [Candidatus Saccharibacteria bacterium]
MSKKQSGFTVVELLTTIIVAALFVAVFYQMFVILVTVNANARNVAQASSLAYSNMRRYPSAASTGLSCTTTTAQPGGISYLLGSSNPTSTPNGDYQDLGSVTEVVTASYPYGCSAIYDVIKLVSVVTYGNGKKISYATYVN